MKELKESTRSEILPPLGPFERDTTIPSNPLSAHRQSVYMVQRKKKLPTSFKLLGASEIDGMITLVPLKVITLY